MDPVTTAVIGWVTGQVATGGQQVVRRVLLGDKQQNALTRVVQEAVASAVTQVVPADEQETVREALQRESPDSAELSGAEIIDLEGAVMGHLLPRLTVLSEQGYRVDVYRFVDTLTSLIVQGIQADAARGGLLQPAAELLRFQLLAGIGGESATRLAELARRPTAFGDLRDSVIDIKVLFDQLGLIEPGAGREKYDTYRTPFVGREWLLENIDSFVASHDRGYILVEGEAGVGKSAFALWLAATRDYPSHFTRLPGGRETASAVRNLGAQLIIQMGLNDLAPGGALPAEASRPSWLQRVIQVASARRKAIRQEKPLVLVVDGLDEAEPASGPPLGLPASLPNGVFYIVTMRVGTPLRWIRDNRTTTKILADDDANLEDMRRYLNEIAIEPRVAAVLRDAEFEVDRFVATLMERCAGVWIYLHYVLEEMRNGSRPPSSLDELPGGLWDYYTENLNSLRSDAKLWDNFFLPLLGTLAAAQEPATPNTLAALANLPDASGEILRFITNKWRSFCVKVSGNRYGLFHQSLRDFLSGMPSLGSEELPEFAAADRSELQAATFEAHRRMAERYLTAWGGLDDGLPTLMVNPHTAEIDTSYGLRHLPAHLEATAQDQKIDRLLACEQPSDSGPDINNVWYSTHDRAGSPDIYLAHLSRASALAGQATTKARAARLNASSIAWEIRYALIAARISGIAANLPPELIAALLKYGVWRPAQALAHIRNNPRADVRARAYSLAVPYLAEPFRTDFLAAALEACEAIRSELTRSKALTSFVEFLSEYGHPEVVSAAFTAALNLHSRRARARVLAALAPHLAEPDREAALAQALTAAQGIDDASAQIEALAALAPHLAEVDREAVLSQALTAAQGIDDEKAKVEAIAILAPKLSDHLLADALTVANSLRDEWARAQTLAALGPYATGDARAGALTSALAAVPAIHFEAAQAEVLTVLAPHLNRKELDESLEFAQGIQDRPVRVRLQAALAAYIPAGRRTSVLTEALGTTQSITTAPGRAGALRVLAPHLTVPQLADALKIAQAISYLPARVQALAALAPNLSPPLLTEALRSAQALGGKAIDIEVLAGFAPHVPEDHRREVVAAALEELRAIEGRPGHSQALASLAPYIPHGDQSAIFAAALNSARVIRSERNRIDALTALARVLPSELTHSALTAVKAIGNATGRAKVLASLAPNLDLSLLGEAFEIAKDIRFQPARAQAVAALAPYLDTSQLGEALQIVHAMSDESGQAQILAALAPSLPTELLSDALTISFSIPYQPAKVRALIAFFPRLPESDRSSVLSAAVDSTLTIRGPRPRAQTLILLAQFLDEPERENILHSALETSKMIEDKSARVEVLAALIPQMPITARPTVLAAALETAVDVSTGWGLVRSISTIAPFLEPTMLADIIERTKVIRSEWIRARILAALAPYLDILDDYRFPDLEQEIRVIGLARGLTHGNAMLIIKAAAGQIALLGGQDAAIECSTAVTDIARWWP